MPGADRLEVRIEAKTFGAHHVLQAVRFSAAPGEVLALLAPSGTGKTTTLRIATGLDTDFDGAVRRPSGRLAVVFQEPLLLPWLSVAANLRLVEPGLTDAEIARFLGLAGLPEKAAAMPKQLSLGMARRVALARALAVRPALLVMDEPFASLDAQLGARLGHDVIAYARSIGAIVLMATHDLDQARSVADRLLVLSGTSPATLGADTPSGAHSAAELRLRFGFLDAE
jgi:ABC-type nitrate/sulfonate/bicarbonate transport system ATPase subunit